MNNITATRIVKSVLQRTAHGTDIALESREFYERLAEESGLAGHWAEACALEIFADLSPEQRAHHIAMETIA